MQLFTNLALCSFSLTKRQVDKNVANDAQHHDFYCNDNQHNDIHQSDIQHNNK